MAKIASPIEPLFAGPVLSADRVDGWDTLVADLTATFGDFDAPVFLSVAEGIAAMDVNKLFYALAPVGDAREGEKRLYLRTAVNPFYQDQGDGAAPLSRSYVEAVVKDGVPAWSDALSAAHFDWEKDRHWQLQPARQFRSFSRLLDYGGSASARATAAALESGNNVAIIAANTVRRSDAGAQIERASSNLLPFHDWAGAAVGVVGSGGAFPTGWELNFPVVREIVGAGIENGRRWICFRLARSGGSPASANINVRTLNAAKMTAPGPIVASGQVQVVSMSGVATGVQVNINEFQADGVTAVGTTSGRLYTPADGRQTYATWRNTAAANKVTQNFNVACSTTGGDFEVVFKIWSPQIEAGEDAEDFTSTMSTADGTNPRAADAIGLLVADGLYDVLTRGDNYDAWDDMVEAVDERLLLPISRRNRKIMAHRAYHSERITQAQKQAISDERAAVLSSIGTTNQNFSDREFWVQSAAQPWSLRRATNKHERYVIECRSGYYWSGDTGMDRVRTEFQCNYKEAYNTDVWVAYNLRMSSPTGITSSSLVLGQFHATEDAGDFSGYPVFELNYHPDGLHIYTASVAAASQPTAYDRVERAAAVPFSLGDWHSVVIRIRFNWQGSAVLQFWLDGQLIVNISGVSIGHNDAVGPYWKHGVYFRFETEDQTVIAEYANFRIGNDSLADRVSNPPVAY